MWDFTWSLCPEGEGLRTQILLTRACPLGPTRGILSFRQMATGYADLTALQTWAVVPLVITGDVIRIHNELAEKYLPKPGTILVTWFHPFLQTRKSLSQHSQSYWLFNVSATLPGDHVLSSHYMCFPWKSHGIQGESTRQRFKVSQKDHRSHGQSHYTVQQTKEEGESCRKSFTGWRI